MSEHIRFQLSYLSNNLLNLLSLPFALSVRVKLSQEVKVKSKKSVYKLSAQQQFSRNSEAPTSLSQLTTFTVQPLE